MLYGNTMPEIITNHEDKTYIDPTASMMKDSISPTVNILAMTEDTYGNEQKDMNVTVNIQKNSVLESMRQSFALNQKIELEALQLDTMSLSKKAAQQLNLKKMELTK
jgi:hypothetical protein